MERYLVISNCQTFGLANSISMLAPRASVVAVDQFALAAKTQESGYADVAFIADSVPHDLIASIDTARIVRVPSLEFAGFHPDLCYVAEAGETIRVVKTPMDDYHSIICFASYLRGLSVEEAIAQFNHRTFEICGYYDLWSDEHHALARKLGEFDPSLRAAPRRWASRRPFMMSINHPVIECLYDIAAAALRQIGVEPEYSAYLPTDNLATGPWFPIYPEIGSRLGYPGSYNFKPYSCYSSISLNDFVQNSYLAYEKYSRASLFTGEQFSARYQAVRALLS